MALAFSAASCAANTVAASGTEGSPLGNCGMGFALATCSGGTPFDVIAVGSLFWQPAKTKASAAPIKMDRDILFIIRSLELTTTIRASARGIVCAVGHELPPARRDNQRGGTGRGPASISIFARDHRGRLFRDPPRSWRFGIDSSR